MANLDIVIVNWNAGGQLLDCLESIAALPVVPSFHVSRCIVVDNASSDGSADGLERLPYGITVIRNPGNKGFGSACNQGAGAGEAEHVLFLNPDVRLFPDSLSKAISFFDAPQNQMIGLLGIQLLDEKGQIQPSAGRYPTPGSVIYQMVGLDRIWPARFPPFVMSDWDHRTCRQVDVLQGAFLLMRRAAFRKLRGFDEGFFMYYEDVDLALRARRAGWTTYYLADARAFHRGGGVTESIQAQRLSYWMQSRVRYIAKHFGRPAAVGIVLASLVPELPIRLIWNLITLSRRHLVDTLRAYRTYLGALVLLLAGSYADRVE